jgi:hypothetical protein
VEILQLLPVDTTPEENKEPHVKEVFQIAFNFSVEELKAFFSNQIHENTIREGDLIHMGNASHAFFLTFQNGHFTLYDPAPIPLKDKSVDTFAAELKKRYFPLEEYMPTNLRKKQIRKKFRGIKKT